MEDVRQNPKCDREVAVYGYLRGTKLKGNARVHIAGVGDATVSSFTFQQQQQGYTLFQQSVAGI